jgi:putative hydrolase of the HAD superfamily
VKKVRCLLFDAVGTLIRPEPSVAAAYQAAGRKFGAPLEEAELRIRFQAALAQTERDDALHRAHATDEAHERRRWQAIVARVFAEVSDSVPLFEQLWRHFAEAANWRLFPDAAVCLERLAALRRGGREFASGVASNFDGRLEPILAALPELGGLQHAFISSQLGARKPSLGFFRAIEQRLHLAPEEVLLVGDDLENDYRGAQRAGWQAILLDRRNEHGLADRVRSLEDLPLADLI